MLETLESYHKKIFPYFKTDSVYEEIKMSWNWSLNISKHKLGKMIIMSNKNFVNIYNGHTTALSVLLK